MRRWKWESRVWGLRSRTGCWSLLLGELRCLPFTLNLPTLPEGWGVVSFRTEILLPSANKENRPETVSRTRHYGCRRSRPRRNRTCRGFQNYRRSSILGGFDFIETFLGLFRRGFQSFFSDIRLPLFNNTPGRSVWRLERVSWEYSTTPDGKPRRHKCYTFWSWLGPCVIK